MHAQIVPILSASYLAVFETAYQPTVAALAPILYTKQRNAAADMLAAALADDQFTANINIAIIAGGDNTSAAVHFLFNCWIALKALNNGYDVDGCIRAAMSAGLTVPAEIQPVAWWNGGYSAYFPPLSGSDLYDIASNLVDNLPEKKIYHAHQMHHPVRDIITEISVPLGYAQSYCYWGARSYFKM